MNLKSKKFHSHHARVITNKDESYVGLVSYNTHVVQILHAEVEKVLALSRHWEYSMSTKKQVVRFLDEHYPIMGGWSVGKIREWIGSGKIGMFSADFGGYPN